MVMKDSRGEHKWISRNPSLLQKNKTKQNKTAKQNEKEEEEKKATSEQIKCKTPNTCCATKRLNKSNH
jgi:hypothetical protein